MRVRDGETDIAREWTLGVRLVMKEQSMSQMRGRRCSKKKVEPVKVCADLTSLPGLYTVP